MGMARCVGVGVAGVHAKVDARGTLPKTFFSSGSVSGSVTLLSLLGLSETVSDGSQTRGLTCKIDHNRDLKHSDMHCGMYMPSTAHSDVMCMAALLNQGCWTGVPWSTYLNSGLLEFALTFFSAGLARIHRLCQSQERACEWDSAICMPCCIICADANPSHGLSRNCISDAPLLCFVTVSHVS